MTDDKLAAATLRKSTLFVICYLSFVIPDLVVSVRPIQKPQRSRTARR
ncbi:MAG: hypothetical protein WAK31_19735 [Chthoniobacterales bacterium]